MAEKKRRKFYKGLLAAVAVLFTLCMAGCSKLALSPPAADLRACFRDGFKGAFH